MQKTAITQQNVEASEQHEPIIQVLVELSEWAKKYYRLQEEVFGLELVDIEA